MRLLGLSFLLCAGACGAAPKPSTDAPYMVPVEPRAAAAAAEKPAGVVAWVHVDNAVDWLETYRALHAQSKASTARSPFGALGMDSSDDTDWTGVSAALTPERPLDAAVRKVGTHVETAVAFSVADEPGFRAAFAKSYRVEPNRGGFDLFPKEPVASDPEAPAPALVMHCAWRSPLMLCTDTADASDDLGAWLRSGPHAAAQAQGITLEIDPSVFESELREQTAKLHSAEARTLVEAFDHAQLRLNVVAGPSLDASVALHFREDVSRTFLFREPADTSGMQRILAHWPADATLSIATAPSRKLVDLIRGESTAAHDQNIVKTLADHSLALGTVVEAGLLKELAAEAARIPLEPKLLEAHRVRMQDALDGYMVGAVTTDDDGKKVTLAQLAKDIASDSKSSARAPRPAGRLPKGSLFVPGAKSAVANDTTADGKNGSLLVPGPNGVLWVFFAGRETYLVEAAQRVLAAPPHVVAPFAPESVARCSWSPAFGSYWQISMPPFSALPQKKARPKKGVLPSYPTTRAPAEARKDLLDVAKELEGVLAKERQAPIAIDVAAITRTRTVTFTSTAPVSTWTAAAANATGPMSVFLLSAVMASSIFMPKDVQPATP